MTPDQVLCLSNSVALGTPGSDKLQVMYLNYIVTIASIIFIQLYCITDN